MKILVVHASAGAGHAKAAEAIYNGFKKYTNYDAYYEDALDHCSPVYKGLYAGTYTLLITHVPWLWGFCFYLLDIPFLQSFVRGFRRIYNLINTYKFHKYLKDEQFDYIISTHFMPHEVACALKRSGKIKSKVIVCVTDLDVHKIWMATGVDTYCVASDWTKEKLKNLGVGLEKIVVTGIPTDEKFSSVQDITELKSKLGLEENLFTVLMATGSFGIGPIEQIIQALQGFQIVVVCGNNEGLFQRLNEKKDSLVKPFGYVNNMHELMAVSDAMVTKPGGLSISEALVSQLPLIFFNAIPGQETNNIKVLGLYGIGISNRPVDKIAEYLVELKFSKDKFLTALKRTKALAHPSAVRDITALIK